MTRVKVMKNRARITRVINSSKTKKIANRIKIARAINSSKTKIIANRIKKARVAKIKIARVETLIQILKSIHRKYA